MSNVTDFNAAKRRVESNQNSDLMSVIRATLSSGQFNHSEVVHRIKGILKSKGIKFQSTHKDIDAKEYPKSFTVIFKEEKLIFCFSSKKSITTGVFGWTVKDIAIKSDANAIAHVEVIVKALDEVRLLVATGDQNKSALEEEAQT